jgi:hypothetical protein
MITLAPTFLKYLQGLREQLHEDPITFIPKKYQKYNHEYYITHRDQYKEAHRKYMEKKKNG